MKRRHAIALCPLLSALSASRVQGAVDHLKLGLIGSGGRGRHVTRTVLAAGNIELAAICDVYRPNAEQALKMNPSAAILDDHRRLLERADIDAVVIGTPDHWHVPILLDALQAGKHVYVEKPVTHESDNSEEVLRAARESRKVIQVGTQQRSSTHMREACEMIRGGELGRLLVVRTHWYQNLYNFNPKAWPIDPAKLDWERWQGRAPRAEFGVVRFKRWRFFRAYSGGLLTDLLAHWIDLVHWFTGQEQAVTAQAMGRRYFMEGTELPDTVEACFDYRGDFQVTFHSSYGFGLEGGGLIFHGTKGMMNVRRDGFELYREADLPRGGDRLPAPAVARPGGRDATFPHGANFVAAIRDGAAPNAPIEAGLKAAQVGHLANRALREGRLLRTS